MNKLEDSTLQEFLEKHPHWARIDGKLLRNWKFADFVAAMAFVNGVAKLAESVGHHPDIDIRYNQVRLGLVTHDAGGITQNDVDMAAKLDKMFGS